MPIIVKPITPYKPRYPVVDCHSHAYKDPKVFLAMAATYADAHEEMPVYGRASIEEAQQTLETVGISKRIIKNFASKPEGVPAANKFAVEIVKQCPCLIPTGSVHPGFGDNEAEVERLAEAGVRGIAFDSCWQGFKPSDRRLKAVYKRISQYRMFILTHTGIDPKGKTKQFLTWPGDVIAVKEMAPDSVIIPAHFGANQQFEKAAEYKGKKGILPDVAWIVESYKYFKVINKDEILKIIDLLGEDMLVYGSDYPWADPGSQLEFWENLLGRESDAWRKISHENAVNVLGIAA